jgi:hypothetical protein
MAERFEDESADIVYIDAEHDYDSVRRDIAAWKPKAKHILAGHDFHIFEAVREAIENAGLVPEVNGNVWHVRV